MRGRREQITKTLVDSRKRRPAIGDRAKVYDLELHGFGVVLHGSGTTTWFIEYGPRGRRRRLAIGTYPALTVDDARSRALVMLGDVEKGHDPAVDKAKRRSMPSVKKWVKQYMVDVRMRKKVVEADKRFLEGVACKRWGAKPLDAITVDDIKAVMQSYAEAGHQISANRFLASIRACLQAAWRAGTIVDNPAKRVQAYDENDPRDRVLSDEELMRFVTALTNEPDPWMRALFQLLIETGARKSEVLRAKWEDMDLESALPSWKIPKTKSGKPQIVPLPKRTAMMLCQLKHVGEYVIPGRHHGKPRVAIYDQWLALKARAELPADVTIHDIRRTFGLRTARAVSIDYASKLLRHSSVKVTEKVYAPFQLQDLSDATEKQADVLPMVRKAKKASHA